MEIIVIEFIHSFYTLVDSFAWRGGVLYHDWSDISSLEITNQSNIHTLRIKLLGDVYSETNPC